MSDLRLRELERRYRETGTTEDKAAWVLALSRAGHLSPKQLKACALMGDEASVQVLQDEGVEVIESNRDNYPRLFMTLACLDYEQHKRAVVAMLALIPKWTATELMKTMRTHLDRGEEGAEALAALEILLSGSTPGPVEIGRTLSGLFRATDEDLQWDCVQRLARLIHDTPVPKENEPVTWDRMLGAVRAELVPRILG